MRVPAEQVTFATVHGGGGEQREAKQVVVTGARPGEPDRPLAARRRAPADGWIILHKCLQGGVNLHKYIYMCVQYNNVFVSYSNDFFFFLTLMSKCKYLSSISLETTLWITCTGTSW